MRRPTILAALALLVAATMPVAASAQEAGPAELRIDTADTSDYPDVRLSVSVPATGDGQLPSESFTVHENGEQQAVGVSYTASDDLQILLLIDTTGSMGGEPLAGAKEAASTFIGDLPDGTDVAVMAYDADARLLTDFGAGVDEHLAAIDGLVADGRTALNDAVVAATEAFPEADDHTSRVVVLLADGEDNESSATVGEAADALTGANVTLHSVEYLTAFTDEATVRQMADATGGSVLAAGDAAELLAVYQQLAADLVSRYELVYTSSEHGPVDVTVGVADNGFTATGSRSLVLPTSAPMADEPEPQVTPVPAPPAPADPEPSGVARTALIVGAILWFFALFLFVLVWVLPRERRSQLWGTAAHSSAGRSSLTELANRASLVADRALQRRGYQSGLNGALERAGIGLRPGEFVVLMLSATFTAFAVGFLLSGWFAGLALATITLITFRLGLSFRAKRRQQRFADQLPETLQLLSGSLRAGYSFMQAIDAVAREADSPSAEEFSRLVVETRLGRDTSDALRAMAERMQSEDFEWVVQAIEIHREVGGDLAEVLDTVAGTIRERNQIRRQVKALSAEGRLSGYILLALPFGVGGLLYMTNRAYIAELVTGGLLGWIMILIGTVLMIIGAIWMRKLVRLVF